MISFFLFTLISLNFNELIFFSREFGPILEPVLSTKILDHCPHLELSVLDKLLDKDWDRLVLELQLNGKSIGILEKDGELSMDKIILDDKAGTDDLRILVWKRRKLNPDAKVLLGKSLPVHALKGSETHKVLLRTCNIFNVGVFYYCFPMIRARLGGHFGGFQQQPWLAKSSDEAPQPRGRAGKDCAAHNHFQTPPGKCGVGKTYPL